MQCKCGHAWHQHAMSPDPYKARGRCSTRCGCAEFEEARPVHLDRRSYYGLTEAEFKKLEAA